MNTQNTCCKKCAGLTEELEYGREGFFCTTPTCECHHPKAVQSEVEEFAKELSEKVRHFAGRGQYPTLPEEEKAYIDGVETAIGMMYIDLTGTPRTKGMLEKLLTTYQHRIEEARREALQRIYDEALPNTEQRNEMALGWGKEDSDYYKGFIEGAKAIADSVCWVIFSIPDCGVTTKPTTPKEPNDTEI